MASSTSLRNDLARLKSAEADLRRQLIRYEGDSAKASEEANRRAVSASRATSLPSMSSHLRGAEQSQRKAVEAGRKAADLSKKLAQNAKAQADKARALRAAEKSEQQALDRESERRRVREKEHARSLARMAPPHVQFVQIQPPIPERLRVLYLTANPHGDLRTDVEVRQVQQALRGAKHRDRISIEQRPAATFQDLLDGLNDVRPHVVHFAGHGGGETVEFERTGDGDGAPHSIDFDVLVSALAATDRPPVLLVLNACDTLEGASAILPAVPVIVAMSDDVPDIAATIFAKQFYSGIASGQSVGAALRQGRVSIEATLSDGETSKLPQHVARDDIDIDVLVLVKV